jgi:hypothetical protein
MNVVLDPNTERDLILLPLLAQEEHKDPGVL